MARSLFPAVENRLVPPLVIRATKDKGVLFPYQAFGQFEADILKRFPKCQAVRVGVKNIDHCARPHGFHRVSVKIPEKGIEVFLRHIVVGDAAVPCAPAGI